MDLKLTNYESLECGLPKTGKQIIASRQGGDIIVYQAYKHAIADYAVAKQRLGGPGFSYDRMSWIKPGFLWMMYRSGWAEKADQERILAISINWQDFGTILADAVLTTFKPKVHEDEKHWKQQLRQKDVRIQWDPDHNPFGHPLERKAMQLGLRGEMLKRFGNEYILKIDDITGFVREQKTILNTYGTARLQVPWEEVIEFNDPAILFNVGMEVPTSTIS